MELFLKEGRNPLGPTNQRQTTADLLVYFAHFFFPCIVFCRMVNIMHIQFYILLYYYNFISVYCYGNSQVLLFRTYHKPIIWLIHYLLSQPLMFGQ